MQPRRAHAAERKAECAICWEPLVEKPLGALLRPGRSGRVCQHLMHACCAEQWVRARPSCPICRAQAVSVEVLPDFVKCPADFFCALDIDGNGSIDKREAGSALRAMLPVDRDGAWVEAHIDSLWERWDEDGNGVISLEEFLRPHAGLLAYVQKHCPSRAMLAPDAQIPPVTDERRWFDYWDEDSSGYLEQNEMVRALIRTFRLEWSLAEMCAVRSLLDELLADKPERLSLDDLTGGLLEALSAKVTRARRTLRNVDALGEELKIGAMPGKQSKAKASNGTSSKRRKSSTIGRGENVRN